MKKQNYSNDYKRDEERDELERRGDFGRGLKILAAVGIGAGICGFRLGRKIGYNRGASDSYKRVVYEIIEATKQHTDKN